jgi:hypothetical protein
VLPDLQDREQNYRLVRGSRYATEADYVAMAQTMRTNNISRGA